MTDAQSELCEQIRIESTGDKPSDVERAIRALREVRCELRMLDCKLHFALVDLQRAMEADHAHE